MRTGWGWRLGASPARGCSTRPQRNTKCPCTATPMTAKASATSDPSTASTAGTENNCPSFIQAFRFGGGAGIWDPNIGPSQDTDTSDPQQHRHHQWIHTAVHRARLDQGIASRPALPTTRQLTQGDPATGATWTTMCFAGPSAHTHSDTAPTPPILDQRAGQPPRPHGERRPDRLRWVRSVAVYRFPSADSVHRFGVRYIRGRRRSARPILPAR